MQWVTQARPKVDRLACPWLITRFIDDRAEFLFVPAPDVRGVAARTGAIPFDVPGVELSHASGRCSFDAFLAKYQLAEPGLARLAAIVRAADNENTVLSAEAAGLRAISFGLASTIRDDQLLLAQGLVLYDALYKWARKLAPETTSRRPERGFARWLAFHRERRALVALEPRLLRDIGVSPAAAAAEARKPFWRR